MRRKGHPSFPSAMTCCFYSSLKTLLMPTEPIGPLVGVNVRALSLAGFQLTIIGRFWVTAEGISRSDRDSYLLAEWFENKAIHIPIDQWRTVAALDDSTRCTIRQDARLNDRHRVGVYIHFSVAA